MLSCNLLRFQSFAGLAGALLIGLGLVGASAAGIYVDRTKKFEEVAKVSYALATVSLICFTVVRATF